MLPAGQSGRRGSGAGQNAVFCLNVTHARRGFAATAAVAALAAATLLSVQGCDAGTPAQATAPGQSAVTLSQAAAIYQSVMAISDDAAAAGAMATGLGVVTNAAWEAVHAEYVSMQATGVPVQRYEYGTPQFYVPRQSGDPRWFMAAVPRHAPGDAAQLQTLMVFTQFGTNGHWTLNGLASLPAGQPLPDIARDPAGYATAVAPGDSSMLVRPEVVGATQAAVVDEGPTTPAATVVSPGPQTTGWYSQLSGQTTSAAAQSLTFSWLMAGTSYPVYALRTAEGGALVLYGMFLDKTTQHPHHGQGTAIPIPTDLQPLMPAGQVALHAYYVTETWQFAAVDPPASAHDGKLSVIAAAGGPSYVHSN
jgi:hypothetical protein